MIEEVKNHVGQGVVGWFRTGIALSAVFVAVPVLADVIQLGSNRDNTLYESDAGDLSNGAGQYMFAGNTIQAPGERIRRGLIHFDVAGSIPSGATINAVTLTLFMSRTQDNTSRAVAVHRVTTDWGEGDSIAAGQQGAGAVAMDADATWKYTFYNTANPPTSPAWTTDGGDFNGPISSTATIGTGTGIYNWGSTPQMVADVQSWLDNPATNYGWILIGDETTTQTARRFNTHEYTNQADRVPQLTIDYTVTGDTGACCLPDGNCIIVALASDCTNQGGLFQGFGTTCLTIECPQPEGACCLEDGSCEVLTESDCQAQSGTYQGDGTACTPDPCPLALTPFVDPLPLPAVAQPISGTIGGTANYQIAMREVQQQLHSQLPSTTLWGYGDGPIGATFPGPTIEASQNAPITVEWNNDLRYVAGAMQGQLRAEHFLPVDTCLHGPDHAGTSARTVVHLHGGHVPPKYDGYPEHTWLPGESATYVYDNNQLPATLWYHDHALGITRLNVMMGLAGFYMLRNPDEQALGLPSGQFEVPIVIQDRTVDESGALQYPAEWKDHFYGEFPVVNGKIWPFHQVKRGKYRYRILNGSNTRRYVLSLSNGASFVLIGVDGGLLDAPVTVSELDLGPAERADVIIDFAPYANNTEITLQNSHAPAGATLIDQIMKFIVQGGGGFTDPVPPSLRTNEVLQEADAVANREFLLRKNPATAPSCAETWWQINGLTWDDITEEPELDTVEIWNFQNPTGQMHPMHMHLVMFQVLDRTPIELDGEGNVVETGPPTPPVPTEMGWKDTVQVQPHSMTRVIARFEDYAGKFAYHCHILEHEDHEMMRQFKAVTPCASDTNESGTVDVSDLLTLLGNWGSCPEPCSELGEINDPDTCAADINRDCDVNVQDLLELLGAWGPCT